MAQTFGTFKSLADQRDREAIARLRAAANVDAVATPLADAASLPKATHQERVNAEMFKAIEVLGRKIDRAFDGNDHLARRLALIESAATVDEKTGKLYLPLVAEGQGLNTLPAPVAHTNSSTAQPPRWMLATTLLSTLIAISALALVALRPVGPTLTTEQLAILDALAQTKMGALTAPLSGTSTPESWQPVEEALPQQEAAPAPELIQPPLQTPEQGEAAPAEAPAETPAVEAPAATAPTPAPSDEEAMTYTPAPESTQVPAQAPTQAPETAKQAEPPATAPAAKTETATEAQAPTQKSQLTQPPRPLVAGLDIGRDPNLAAALRPVEARAMEGVAEAQHDLATAYAAGKDTKQDYKRAAYWFAQAADAGIANAHYNLGVMFQQGMGLRKDSARAISWYEKAAALGHPEAMYNLGIAYIEGVGAERNVERGIGYFEKAAAAGVAQAAYNLGVLYESGFAGPIDLATAGTWYARAAELGHSEGRKAMLRLEQQTGKPSRTSSASSLTPADLVEPNSVKAKTPAAQKSGSLKNEMVAKVQRALIGRGLLPAPATGTLDARTQDAIRAFQQANGLPVDGTASKDLLAKINQTSR